MFKYLLKGVYVFGTVFFCHKSSGQNLNPLNTSNIVPPSPEVSALGKYIEMPIGYSTGIPEISIPLYSAKSGELVVPVSLSYNASGIKVEEVATWAGLGWSLNAGGSISRVVRGLPDDYGIHGYMYTTKTVPYILALPVQSPERLNILYNNANQGELDIEPDIFMFSAMGYSGKFYFDQQSGSFVMSPTQRVKVDYTTENGFIKAFVLTLPNGVKCYFGKSADNSRVAHDTHNFQQTTNIVNGTTGIGVSNAPAHITGWSLLNVVHPAGKTISCYYSSYNASDFGNGGESTEYAGISGCEAATGQNNSSSYVQNSTKSVIDRISFDVGDIYFVRAATFRQDVLGDQHALDSVVIKNKQGIRIKSFSLEHSYITHPDTLSVPMADAEVAAFRRLFLMSVTEVGSSGIALPPYEFVYNSTALPSRTSYSQDYWGYYNGKSNSVLTPRVPVSLLYGTSTGEYFPGADRRIDSNFTKAGILTKLVYPTGGTTEYFYEINEAPVQFLGVSNGFTESYLSDKSKFFFKSEQFKVSTGPDIYVDSFTVGDIVGMAKITANFDGCTDFNSQDCQVDGIITGITDPGFSFSINAASSYTNLPEGKYKIEVTISILNLDDPVPDFNLLVNWSEDPDLNNFYTGGLRLRKIVSTDGAGGKLAKSFSYKKFSDSTISSGTLYNLPVHAFRVFCGSGNEISPTILKIVSGSALPLASPDGQIIRYANVTEYHDEDKSSFKTEYTLSVYQDYVVANESNYPFPSHVMREWRSGLLLNKKEYEKTGPGTYRVLTDMTTVYKNFATVVNDSFGIAISPYPTANSFGFTPYRFVSEWFLPDSTTSTLYAYHDGQTSTITTYTKSYYNDRFALAVTRTRNSEGKVIDKKFWYPYDYDPIPETTISDLNAKHIIEIPVKQETSIGDKLTSGSIIVYNINGQPTESHVYENRELADTTAHNRNTLFPSGYQLKTNFYYDVNNNISQVLSWASAPVTYLWNYEHTYPVAQVTGADSSAIAFTGFEADENGNWNVTGSTRLVDGITGASCYQLSDGDIIRSGLNSTSVYILTYWLKQNTPLTISGTQGIPTQGRSVGDWKCFMHHITGVTQLTISGNGLIDELRLHPRGALMTTYTYEPLIGLTSQCDIANKIMYYEYDSFGRLKLIRDQDKNILKTFDYQYQANTNQ